MEKLNLDKYQYQDDAIYASLERKINEIINHINENSKKKDIKEKSNIDLWRFWLLRATEIIEDSKRQTGRTTRILEEIKSGDCLIVHNQDKKYLINDELKKRKKHNITVISCDSKLIMLRERLGGQNFNKIYYDNCWLYLYIQNYLKNITKELDLVSVIHERKIENGH